MAPHRIQCVLIACDSSASKKQLIILIPVAELEKAVDLSRKSDFFLVLGSTLLVQPAAQIPIYAKDNGAFLAIVNLSDTPCDKMCKVLVWEKAEVVLQKIVAAI